MGVRAMWMAGADQWEAWTDHALLAGHGVGQTQAEAIAAACKDHDAKVDAELERGLLEIQGHGVGYCTGLDDDEPELRLVDEPVRGPWGWDRV